MVWFLETGNTSAGKTEHYQAELGLQLDLEALKSPLQVGDLGSRRLQSLRAACHHLVQVFKLKKK